jgi:hypothetical protein
MILFIANANLVQKPQSTDKKAVFVFTLSFVGFYEHLFLVSWKLYIQLIKLGKIGNV